MQHIAIYLLAPFGLLISTNLRAYYRTNPTIWQKLRAFGGWGLAFHVLLKFIFSFGQGIKHDIGFINNQRSTYPQSNKPFLMHLKKKPQQCHWEPGTLWYLRRMQRCKKRWEVSKSRNQRLPARDHQLLWVRYFCKAVGDLKHGVTFSVNPSSPIPILVYVICCKDWHGN